MTRLRTSLFQCSARFFQPLATNNRLIINLRRFVDFTTWAGTIPTISSNRTDKIRFSNILSFLKSCVIQEYTLRSVLILLIFLSLIGLTTYVFVLGFWYEVSTIWHTRFVFFKFLSVCMNRLMQHWYTVNSVV